MRTYIYVAWQCHWSSFLNSSTVIFGVFNFSRQYRGHDGLAEPSLSHTHPHPPTPIVPWPFQPSCLYQHDTSLGLVFPPVAARAVASHWIHTRNSPFYRGWGGGGGGSEEGKRHVCQSDRAALFTQQTHQWNSAVNIVPHSPADTDGKKTSRWSELTETLKKKLVSGNLLVLVGYKYIDIITSQVILTFAY